MKNSFTIANMADQLAVVCATISSFAKSADDVDATADVFESLLIDELEHAQMLTLKLTELVTDALSGEDNQPTQNADGEGSVFAQGDLDSHGKDNDVQH